MGSIANAVVPGFLCRLCSKIHRCVILIYGDRGRAMRLHDKINEYLPITVSPLDNLPKSVCLNCIQMINGQHKFMMNMCKTTENRIIKQTIYKIIGKTRNIKSISKRSKKLKEAHDRPASPELQTNSIKTDNSSNS